MICINNTLAIVKIYAIIVLSKQFLVNFIINVKHIGGFFMSENTIVPVSNDVPLVDQLSSFLSTADGSIFSICAGLYNIILGADTAQRPVLFEKAINLYEDIDSDETIKAPVSPYDGQKKVLKEKYGDIVNSFIEFFISQKDSTEVFYENIWQAIQSDIFFPTEGAKVFAFYYVVIDSRVPYFELEQGYGMSNESYRKLREKHAALLKKVRYILNAEFDQKTEQASILLQELGISMPSEEDSVETVNAYEQKLMVVVEIINEMKKPEIPLATILKQMHDRLPG